MTKFIDANNMRILTKDARKIAKVHEKLEEERASSTLAHWWRATGYSELLQAVELGARTGKTTYTGNYEHLPPDFVLADLRDLGFEVSTEAKVRPKSWPRSWCFRPEGYILKIEWPIYIGGEDAS